MPPRFSPWQIRLHWLTLLLIALAYAAIEAKGYIPKSSPNHDFAKLLHYNFGVLVWLLMLVRVGLRLRHPKPAITPAPPRWQMVAAGTVHRLLYLSFLALPVLGMLTLAWGGTHWQFLGIAVPDLLTADRAAKGVTKEIHETWADLGYFLIGLHAAAALFHHYLLRDDTMIRMLPRR